MTAFAAFWLTLVAVPCAGSGPGCTVEATVDGRRMPLVVDTGADLTVLTRDGARRAGIRTERDAPYIFVRGVAGTSVAWLARATITVGRHEEEDVLVAVVDDLDLGQRAVGLLGMSYLERFDAQMGHRLELEPVDADDPEKRGGRGRSWWRLRFRQVDARLDAYRSLVAVARSADRKIESSIGTSASGDSLEDMVERLTEFMKTSQRRLRQSAARAAVPLDWRR